MRGLMITAPALCYHKCLLLNSFTCTYGVQLADAGDTLAALFKAHICERVFKSGYQTHHQ